MPSRTRLSVDSDDSGSDFQVQLFGDAPGLDLGNADHGKSL